jgi:hypothetical protein
MSTTSTIRPRADSLSTIHASASDESFTSSNSFFYKPPGTEDFLPENSFSHARKSSEIISLKDIEMIIIKGETEQRNSQLVSQSSRDPLIRESEKARIITPVMKDKGMFRNMWKKFVEGLRTLVFCEYVH